MRVGPRLGGVPPPWDCAAEAGGAGSPPESFTSTGARRELAADAPRAAGAPSLPLRPLANAGVASTAAATTNHSPLRARNMAGRFNPRALGTVKPPV